MPVRRGLTRFVAGLVTVPMVVMAANGGAQQTGTRPPGPELPATPQPGRVAPVSPQPPAPAATPGQTGRSKFRIDPQTPVKDLLPTPPETAAATGPLLTDDLAKVPEAAFEAWPAGATVSGKVAEQMAHQLAKIDHANAKQTDGFVAALVENREDLA